MIINMTGGGVGNALNFDVMRYATEAELLAATPKENTIGVISSTEITSWVFSATQPSSPSSGMVWISTGASSDFAFNVLKKNEIQVYPLSAKQYVNDAWAKVTAMSYQSGSWSNWITDTYLYYKGDECTSITGGWITEGKSVGSNFPSTTLCTVSRGASSIKFELSGTQKSSSVKTTNKYINMFGYTGIRFKFSSIVVNATNSLAVIQLRVLDSSGSAVATKTLTTTELEFEIPFSNVDSGYIEFTLWTAYNASSSQKCSFTMTECEMVV